jgi:hypothetical protein
MRLKIPIIVELDGRLSPKEVSTVKGLMSDIFTHLIAEAKGEKDVILDTLLQHLSKHWNITNLEILSEEEFLNRIR